jgi:hypothetical protein
MHHLIGSCHDLLVCAASEVLGALDHVGDVEVVVQDVDVLVRLEAGDGSHREPQGEERMQERMPKRPWIKTRLLRSIE